MDVLSRPVVSINPPRSAKPGALTETLLKDLTDPQRQAVMHGPGPLLVVAAAGSGKTRVITRRVGYLMAGGVTPQSILAITFTNKAAGEMKQRVAAIFPGHMREFGRLDQPGPLICTFHSLCLRILRHYAGQVGLPPGFTIYDSADQLRVVKQVIETVAPNIQQTPGSVHAAISNAKNRLLDPEAFAASVAGHWKHAPIAEIYRKYQAQLQANHALDFDDLLMRTVQILRGQLDIRGELQERFEYVLVDEYQDTNHAQYVLTHALAQRPRNICVVGDPDQSIYAWRGADINNILDFEKDYPDATVIPLEQNYRSTQTILAVADQLISHNAHRKPKRLFSENAVGDPVRFINAMDERAEAQAIAGAFQHLHNDRGIAWNQMAVFYRMNSLTRVMEDALRRAYIPYQIARGVEFYGRKEIKDVLAYLRVIANPNDEVNLSRILNVPTRGIGASSINLLEAHAVAAGISLWDALRQPEKIFGLPPRAAQAARQFRQLLESLQPLAAEPGGVKALTDQLVARTGLRAMLEKLDPDIENEQANVNELISSAAEFDRENPTGTLIDYLSAVSLVSDVDRLEDGSGAVTLMTLHAAKGLEFPVVAIIGLEEGCLPHARAWDDPRGMEEERRLFFVGITRTQHRLLLSRANRRMIRGRSEPTRPSRFLAELPQDHVRVEHADEPDFTQEFADETEPSGFHVGQKVRHPAYGIGRIAEISQTGGHPRLVVDFVGHGRKTLLAEYAPLSPA